jgi:hypothetical protein
VIVERRMFVRGSRRFEVVIIRMRPLRRARLARAMLWAGLPRHRVRSVLGVSDCALDRLLQGLERGSVWSAAERHLLREAAE